MRSIIACGIILLGLNGTAHEPAYFTNGRAASPLVEIDSATGRSDRLTVATLAPRALTLQIFRPTAADLQLRLASANADLDADLLTNPSAGANDIRGTAVSLDDLCQALFTSAQANDIPVQFFANLIWQESRLNPGDVSKKGAQGIAQFMPSVAAEKGLDDPFNPIKALPASARLLRELRMQFGNLGLVAAAYNAGPGRVARWLERRVDLPRETRNYVVKVTGLSVDAWRNMRVSDEALTFVGRLPCRSMPAFATVEQEQQTQTEAKIEQAKLEQADVTGAIADLPALPPALAGAHDVEMKPETNPAHGRDKKGTHHTADKGKHAPAKPAAPKLAAPKLEASKQAAANKQAASKPPAVKPAGKQPGKREVEQRADKRRV
jgi:Transglycosylase SLT domain